MTTLRKLARYALLAAAAVAFAVFVVLAGEGAELPVDLLPVRQLRERHDPRDEGS